MIARAFLVAALALAGTAGALSSVALSVGNAQAPTRTVTVNVGTGAQGPPGPPGPKGDPGPAGATDCPNGYSPGVLVINQPGGHVQIATCLQD